MNDMTYAARLKIVKEMSKEGRPISKLANIVKSNNATLYNSGDLIERSKKSARKRAERYNRVAKQMIESG